MTAYHGNCKKTYVTLRVYPEVLTPEDVTTRLGIKPSSTQAKGAPRSSKSATPLVYPVNGWFLTSEGEVESTDFEEHLRWLFARLAPAQSQLEELRLDSVAMDFACYWVSANGHGGPTVSVGTAADLAKFGIDLWFDIYFGGRTSRGS